MLENISVCVGPSHCEASVQLAGLVPVLQLDVLAGCDCCQHGEDSEDAGEDVEAGLGENILEGGDLVIHLVYCLHHRLSLVLGLLHHFSISENITQLIYWTYQIQNWMNLIGI